MRRSRLLVVLSVCVPFILVASVEGGIIPPPTRLYWINKAGAVKSSKPDGTDQKTVYSAAGATFRDLAVDAVGKRIYLTDRGTGSGFGKIVRMKLDGTGLTNLFTGLTGPEGITLDAANGKLYWSDPADGNIYRGNTDGSGKVTLVASLSSPKGVKFSAGMLYWVEAGAPAIKSIDISTLVITSILTTGLNEPARLTVLISQSRIYFTDSGAGTVEWVPISGGSSTVIEASLVSPIGIDAYKDDADDIHVLWTLEDNVYITEDVFTRAPVNIVTDPDKPFAIRLVYLQDVPAVSAIGIAVLVLAFAAAGAVVIRRARASGY